jgi:glycosyltransferase involved in cell wall biosynthesis
VRILQLHSHHAAKGGATEVMDHERALLEAAGHTVEQYTVPAVRDAGLPAWRAGAKAVWNRDAARAVTLATRRVRPDVVHAHTPFPLMSPAVFRAAAAEGVPTLATLHSYRYSCIAGTCVRDGAICEDCVGSRLKLSGVRHRCYHDDLGASTALTVSLDLHRAIGTFHRSVTRYLTLTDFSRRLLVRDGFPPDRVVVKPNSVPDEGFRHVPSSPERRVVFAGRFIELKGVRTLLDAWASAAPVGVRLVLAGDGELRPLVEHRAAVDPSIEYVGWVEQAEVARLMGSAELVVVPSQWYEGAPLVILRSLGVGTPVLVSDLENLSTEVVQDSAGWTFATGDPASLAQQLTLLTSRPDRTLKARSRARRSYEERYAPSRDLERLEGLYAAVVDRTAGEARN